MITKGPRAKTKTVLKSVSKMQQQHAKFKILNFVKIRIPLVLG